MDRKMKSKRYTGVGTTNQEPVKSRDIHMLVLSEKEADRYPHYKLNSLHNTKRAKLKRLLGAMTLAYTAGGNTSAHNSRLRRRSSYIIQPNVTNYINLHVGRHGTS